MHLHLLVTNIIIQYDITIITVNIIHRAIFYIKHDVSETGFCLCLAMESTQLESKDKISRCLHT
jgi:hypothetical protein